MCPLSTQLPEEPAPSLPAELTDEIIAWIGVSPTPWRDLSSCSIVCKAWLPASRSHLFHSIQITLGKATRWNAFLKSSHLTSYLRHVEILEKPELTRELSYEQADAQTNQVYELLPQIAQLTTVRSLCVDVISWLPLGEDHVAYLCAAFRNITDLELRSANIRDNVQLMHILSHFTLLERVSLTRVKVKDFFEETPGELAGKLSPLLHTLRVSYRKALLGPDDWLCEHYPLTSVRNLELCDIPPSEVISAGSLIRHLGEQLSSLVLSFRSSADFPSIPTHVQPRFNTKLRTVHVILDLTQYSTLRRFSLSLIPPVTEAPSSESEPVRCWTWLSLFLSAIPSALDSLTLEMNGDLVALVALDWGLLAQALDGPQFSLLRILKIEIPLRGGESHEDVDAVLRQRLPGIYARGILQVNTPLMPSVPEDTVAAGTIPGDMWSGSTVAV